MRKARYIILADDDDDDRIIFREIIELISTSIILETVEDGAQLLQKLTHNHLPDIIFLDLNMPCMSGEDCLKTLRKDSCFDIIPIIIYSTSGRKEDIDRTYRLGANLYVIKPSTYSGLEYTLREVLNIKPELLLIQVSRDKFVYNK
jgi:CheY-like chemotaxis protein